jgi:hypothetical protein
VVLELGTERREARSSVGRRLAAVARETFGIRMQDGGDGLAERDGLAELAVRP